MENRQHIKGVRVSSNSSDPNKSTRIKYASTKQRSKHISADVYRIPISSKGGWKSGSGLTREGDIHHAKPTPAPNPNHEEDSKEAEESIGCQFGMELDVALDQNGSEVFLKCYKEIWPLCRSLPELLHHFRSVLNIVLDHLLTEPSLSSTTVNPPDAIQPKPQSKITPTLNHATLDLLHLLSVLAKDLRHELQPVVYTHLFHRLLGDGGLLPVALGDLEVIESLFRTLSYVVKYALQDASFNSTMVRCQR